MLPIIEKDCILCDVDAKSKDEVLNLMVNTLNEAGYLSDRDVFYEDVLKREEEFATYVGYETGIPHGKSKAVINNGLCICNLKEPVKWNDENEKVKLVIMIAVTDSKDGLEHLMILATLSRMLMHEDFRLSIRTGTKESIYALMKEKLMKDKLME